MNATAIRTAGKYLGAWGAIVFSVVLLSVIFNILGTITGAVLVGMMMGAFKGAKWLSVWVSLVFPGVFFGLVRTARVEFTPQQVILLGCLCFIAYWATYLVSAFVIFYEQKERNSSRLLASEPATMAPGGRAVAPGCAELAEPLESPEPRRESCLEQLEGNWLYEASSAGESLYKKIIQIKAAKLELKAIAPSGQITLLARGDVMLQSLRPAQTLVIPPGASEPADFIGSNRSDR
jgi:hypothetical protein